MIVSGFGKFHQKKFSAVHPLLQLFLAMGHSTLLSVGARTLEEPATNEHMSIKYTSTFVTALGWCRFKPNSPLTDFENSCGEAILPAVLVILGVEHAVLMLL